MTSTSVKRTGYGTVAAICFLVMVLEGYDIQAFGVAAPQLVGDFGLNAAQQGSAASAAMLGLVIGAMAGGWLADRVGRKPVLFSAVLAFGLASLWTAVTRGYGELLAARLATGLGFGGALPMVVAIAAEVSPAARRGGTAGMMFCGMPAGGSAVALLMKLAAGGLAWRTVFVIGGGVPLLLLPLILFVLPETRSANDPTADRSEGALFGGGRLATTLLLWAANFLTLVVLYLMLNWLPSLVVARGHAPADGAAAALSFNLMGVVGALVLGVIADRLGVRWTLAFGYLSLGAAMTALGAAADMPLVLTLAGLAGFMIMGVQYALYALAPTFYPGHARAFASGAAVSVGRFGSIVGPMLAGQLRQAGWGPGEVLGAMMPVVVVAGLAVFVLSGRIDGPRPAPSAAA